MVVKIDDICNKIKRIQKIVEKEEDVSIAAIRAKSEKAFSTFYEELKRGVFCLAKFRRLQIVWQI